MTDREAREPDNVTADAAALATETSGSAGMANVDQAQSDGLAWLAGRLSGQGPFWVRAATCRQNIESPFQLRLLEITAGVCPDGWEALSWTYPNALFVAQINTGAEIFAWIRQRRVLADEIDVPFEAQLQAVRVERRDSRQQSQYSVLSWPTYEITLAYLTNNEPPSPLVSAGEAPSFINLYAAATSFFGLGTHAVGGSLPAVALFRWQDLRARINRVNIGPDELSVEVEGDSLRDLTVELAGDRPGTRERLWPHRTKRSSIVEFALPEGLPAGAWVLIRRGEEWLDRRHLTWPWARGTEPGVETEIDAPTKIGGYIANRENPAVEFKREVPASEDGKARAMKTVCAYANGAGGVMLFGITDDYEVTGVPATKVGGLVDQLTQMIHSWLEPTPHFTFNELALDDEHFVVLELHVSAGHSLYGSARPNDAKRVYVRHYSTSVPARISEIEAICRARNLSASYR
ncbi:MAG: ATP-binding protein [Jatrophihabitantaceae bacterium]